jgi:hypothetical protein
MSALVEDIWEDIEKIINKKPSRNSSRGQLSSRNQSTESLQSNKSFNNFIRKFLKVHVVHSTCYVKRSFENSRIENNKIFFYHFQNNISKVTTIAMEKLPRDYIAAIANVVNSILYIEEHVEKLIQTSAWDASGLPSKKLRRASAHNRHIFWYVHIKIGINIVFTL